MTISVAVAVPEGVRFDAGKAPASRRKIRICAALTHNNRQPWQAADQSR